MTFDYSAQSNLIRSIWFRLICFLALLQVKNILISRVAFIRYYSSFHTITHLSYNWQNYEINSPASIKATTTINLQCTSINWTPLSNHNEVNFPVLQYINLKEIWMIKLIIYPKPFKFLIQYWVSRQKTVNKLSSYGIFFSRARVGYAWDGK